MDEWISLTMSSNTRSLALNFNVGQCAALRHTVPFNLSRVERGTRSFINQVVDLIDPG